MPRAAFASFFAMNSSRRLLLSDMTWPRCKSVNASTLMCLMPNFLQKNCRRFQQKWHEDPWCNCRSPAGHFSSAQILQLECFCQHRPNGLPRFITSGIESSKSSPKLIRLIALNQKVSRVCSGLGARHCHGSLVARQRLLAWSFGLRTAPNPVHQGRRLRRFLRCALAMRTVLPAPKHTRANFTPLPAWVLPQITVSYLGFLLLRVCINAPYQKPPRLQPQHAVHQSLLKPQCQNPNQNRRTLLRGGLARRVNFCSRWRILAVVLLTTTGKSMQGLPGNIFQIYPQWKPLTWHAPVRNPEPTIRNSMSDPNRQLLHSGLAR